MQHKQAAQGDTKPADAQAAVKRKAGAVTAEHQGAEGSGGVDLKPVEAQAAVKAKAAEIEGECP
jgi:hypothetical protein